MTDDDAMDEQHTIWEDWAQADPLWAILSDPTRKGGRWELDEFFASGDHDVEEALRECAEHGLARSRPGARLRLRRRTTHPGTGIPLRPRRRGGHLRDHGAPGERAQPLAGPRPVPRQHDRRPGPLGRRVVRLRADDHRAAAQPTCCRPPVHRRVRAHPAPRRHRGVRPDLDARQRLAARRRAPGRAELLDAPSTLAPGESAIATVRVTNTSGVDWPPASRLALGNHWLREDGAMAVQDDGRTPLGDGLATQPRPRPS